MNLSFDACIKEDHPIWLDKLYANDLLKYRNEFLIRALMQILRHYPYMKKAFVAYQPANYKCFYHNKR